jgi:hypothetical protein
MTGHIVRKTGVGSPRHRATPARAPRLFRFLKPVWIGMVLSAFWAPLAGAQETMPYDLAPASAFQPTTNGAQTDQTFGTGGLHEEAVPRDLRPFQLLLPREHFPGDWAGPRTELERMGITPTLSLVTDVAANPSGGRSRGITEASNLGLDLLFDLDKIGGVKDATFLLQLSQRWGSSLSKDYIGNIFTTQQFYFKGNSLFFQPDLQYIFHPGGSGQTADALVVGCQAGINF